MTYSSVNGVDICTECGYKWQNHYGYKCPTEENPDKFPSLLKKKKIIDKPPFEVEIIEKKGGNE